MLPLVTCLCLTRNRRDWLPQAIACFQAQTYSNRELLIVADGEDIGDLLPYGDAQIREMRSPDRMSIGNKRNLGCEAARGEIIAHWDDDDYSAERRLEDQVRRLLDSGKAVTGYHSMKFREANGRWWLYRNEEMHALGTSLCYRRDWWRRHVFGTHQIGEDGDFSTAAWREHQLVTAPAEDFMYATNHPGNTCRRSPDPNNWTNLPPDFSWPESISPQ